MVDNYSTPEQEEAYEDGRAGRLRDAPQSDNYLIWWRKGRADRQQESKLAKVEQ